MNAAKMRVRDRIHAVEPATRQIAFRTLGLASKHLGIELNQSFPVSRDQIGVNVFGADWHFLLDKLYKYHNVSADVILSGAKNL